MAVNGKKPSLTLQEIYRNLEALRQEELRSFATDSSIDFSTGFSNSFFIKINKISSDKDFPHAQALENVLAIYRNLPARFIYYIKSDGSELSFYLGVRTTANGFTELSNYAQILENAVKGNFRGTVFGKSVNGAKVCQDLLDPAVKFSTVMGVPTLSAKQEEAEFQSLDYVLHCMNGIPFHILITWESVDLHELNDLDSKLSQIFNALTPFANTSESSSQSNSTNERDVSNRNNSNCKTEVDKSYSFTNGSNANYSNKRFIDLQNLLDKELKERLSLGKAKGLYHTAIYLGARTDSALALLESSFTSVFQSDTPSSVPLVAKRLPKRLDINRFVAAAEICLISTSASWLAVKARRLYLNKTSLATLLTVKELSIIAGFPRYEVAGLALSSCVSFGLNQPNSKGMTLGRIMQDGGELPQYIKLPLEDLERHIFVAGTTGSGKTTTCHRILSESQCPFLVIEPAKTEYRSLINAPSMGDIYVFTVGSESEVPFRFNPFEFLPSENVSSHIDMLKACFMSSFKMEAAMPNLLEEAMYRIYEQFGWNITTNQNRYLDKREDAWSSITRGSCFPTISDYIAMVQKVVEEKDFGERLGKEYSGSLLARLVSLKTGTKGKVLNTRRSIDFNWLLNQKVVIELEELRFGEDKSFMMALIVTRLVEAIKAKYKQSQQDASVAAASGHKRNVFRHIMLIEEAHRLLSRTVSPHDSAKSLGVEILTDMLAEVRKYHESIIIVDQIPSKLTPDVLKNTNTKIVHRLFAEDDKTAIADAIALSDQQKKFISKLNIGEAIISGNGWDKPIHTKISQLFDTSKLVSDQEAFSRGRKYWTNHPELFCPFTSNQRDLTPSLERLQSMQEMAELIFKGLDIITSNTSQEKIDFEEWSNLLQTVQSKYGYGYKVFARRVISQYLLIMSMLQTRFLTDFNLSESYESNQQIAFKLVPDDPDTDNQNNDDQAKVASPKSLFKSALMIIGGRR